jgi:Arc/MetJ-type ribon-helix-helix transcriptional regulator
MKTQKKAMTVRIPLDLYHGAAEIARRRRTSMSNLVRQSLQETLEHDRRRRLYEAFTRVAEDAHDADVEFAFDAQAEVVRNGKS